MATNFQGYRNSFGIFNALIPQGGPKSMPFYIDWTTGASFLFDIQNQQSRDYITDPQTIYFDNSQCPNAVTIKCETTNQVLTLPPYSQGYLPIMMITPPRWTMTNIGATGATGFYLLNIPVPAIVWNTAASGGSYDGNGNLLVRDTVLDGAVSNGKFLTQQYVTADADVVKPLFVADRVGSTGNITAAGDTASQIVGAPGYFVTEMNVFITGNATQGVAGLLTIGLKDNGVTLMALRTYVPNAAPAAPAASFRVGGWGPGSIFNSKNSNQTLQVNLSAALTAGQVYIVYQWGTTSLIG